MQLIRERNGRAEIELDSFQHVSDNEAVPERGPIVVTLARWLAEHETLAGRDWELGVRLSSDARVEAVSGDLARLSLIEIEFPKFVDGRGYSIARRLRDELGFRGQVRAVGNVLRDQLLYMRRCGFDAFEVDPQKSPEDALAAFAEYSVFYQPAADLAQPLWRRHARSRA